MSESPNSPVDCPVCEAEFDPAAAGGWCTNSECGEWRYDSPDPAAADGEDDARSDTPETEADDEGTSTTPETETVEDGDAGSQTSEGGDATDTGAATTDDGSVDIGADSSAETGAISEIDCPSCGETLGADANFCPSCGEDVSEVDPEADDEVLTECPDCGVAIDSEDSFCASCGTDLDAHRESTELTDCPGCGADIGSEDSFCVSCGEDLDAHREPTEDTTAPAVTGADDSGEAGTPVPDSLVLGVRGERLTVSDGDTVGRELRRIVTETGGTESDAVRIHREHVRFERETDGFYLVALGRNPTALNGTPMDEGDREPLGSGDELTLSGVVTLAVRVP